MKSATTAVQQFMATAPEAWRPNCYTFTLSGGAVLRYTDADKTVVVPGGFTFTKGPPIEDGGYSNKRGLEAGTIDVTLYCQAGDATHAVNGVPITQFIENGGFVGANLMVERALAPDPWSTIVGTYQRFSGRFSQVTELTDLYDIATFSDWREILDQNMPPQVYQPNCRHVLGDSRCTIDLSTYAVTGTVSASPSPTSTVFATNLAAADAYYGLGKIKFTSGANAGLWRTVKSYTHSTGLVTTIIGFPSPPAVGDAFTIYPGCDLTSGTCTTRFANLIHFGGEEFTPVPETPY